MACMLVRHPALQEFADISYMAFSEFLDLRAHVWGIRAYHRGPRLRALLTYPLGSQRRMCTRCPRRMAPPCALCKTTEVLFAEIYPCLPSRCHDLAPCVSRRQVCCAYKPRGTLYTPYFPASLQRSPLRFEGHSVRILLPPALSCPRFLQGP